MYKPDYGKVHTITTYHEGQEISQKQDYEVSQYSTTATMLKDLIEALEVITSGKTHKLELCINVDHKGRYRIVKKWGVE